MTYTDEQIATLLAGRTPGEWTYSEYHPWVNWGNREPEPSYELDGPIFSLAGYDTLDREGDAAFIAAAPAIVSQLLARIKELETMEKAIVGLDTFLFLLISMTERDDPPTYEQINANARDAVVTMRRIMGKTVDDTNSLRLFKLIRSYF